MQSDKPVLIEGGISVDDRGQIAFVNGFDFEGVRRFYTVSNHRAGFVRAWHGHKKEAKYVTAVAGSALVCAVRIVDWGLANPSAHVSRYVLSAAKPAVLYIPPSYANGWMSLVENTRLMFFSTAPLEESIGDDIRLPAKYWNPWSVEER